VNANNADRIACTDDKQGKITEMTELFKCFIKLKTLQKFA